MYDVTAQSSAIVFLRKDSIDVRTAEKEMAPLTKNEIEVGFFAVVVFVFLLNL